MPIMFLYINFYNPIIFQIEKRWDYFFKARFA